MSKEITINNNDSAIWSDIKSGNERSFEIIYDKYFSLLYSYGFQISTNTALVKDCIQNLFVELWRNKSNLSEVICVRNYLYISLRRKIIKELIKENKFKWDQLSETYDLEVVFSQEILMINDQSAQEIKEKLQKSFKNLTRRQKEAIFLKFYENMDYENIAVVLSLKSPKYARALIYRAIDVLKFNFNKELIY